MLRGVNRCIIEVNHPSSRYFEKAILYVKPQWSGLSETRLQDSARELFLDLETGAGGLTPETCAPGHAPRRRLRKGRLFLFAMGAAVVGLVAVVCVLLGR